MIRVFSRYMISSSTEIIVLNVSYKFIVKYQKLTIRKENNNNIVVKNFDLYLIYIYISSRDTHNLASIVIYNFIINCPNSNVK